MPSNNEKYDSGADKEISAKESPKCQERDGGRPVVKTKHYAKYLCIRTIDNNINI